MDEDYLDRDVLSLLTEDGSLSITSVAEMLGATRSSVVRSIDRLRDSGMLTRVGGNRGRWVVNAMVQSAEGQRS